MKNLGCSAKYCPANHENNRDMNQLFTAVTFMDIYLSKNYNAYKFYVRFFRNDYLKFPLKECISDSTRYKKKFQRKNRKLAMPYHVCVVTNQTTINILQKESTRKKTTLLSNAMYRSNIKTATICNDFFFTSTDIAHCNHYPRSYSFK